MAIDEFRAHLINLRATLETGWAHSVALRSDEDLGESLAELQLDEEIPDTLYRTVAEIIAFV